MKVPVSWLADYIDIDACGGFEPLAESLTMAGLEVEEIHPSPIGPVYITKVTPNRGDWMAIAGVAREARAALGLPEPAPLRSRLAAFSPPPQPLGPLSVPIRIDCPAWCSRYAAMAVDIPGPGVSPPWMQERLLAAGMRPINAVVDVTNYVMIELGQPLHAFDLDRLGGPEIIVRAAAAGEEIVTIDGGRRALSEDVMVIADAHVPVAVAGIMGGRDTEVTPGTRRVLIESAHFDPARVRATAKALDLSTDASYRFERHVDPSGAPIALAAAAALIAQLTGGKIVPGLTDLYPHPARRRSICLRIARAKSVLGLPSVGESALGALELLGFGLSRSGTAEADYDVSVPTHRPDIAAEIDVVEEIGRMIGYGTLPEILPASRAARGGYDSEGGEIASRVRSMLIGQGLTEAYSHTLTGPSPFDDRAQDADRVRIRTALSSELSTLRRSLVPGLIDAVGRNARLRTPDIALFEVGKVFRRAAACEYKEAVFAAAIVQGDYAGAKGIAENVFRAYGLEFPETTESRRPGMHPHRCASLVIDGVDIGFIAEVDPGMLEEHLGLQSGFGRVACFEIAVERIAMFAAGPKKYAPLPKFPEITRDLAMVFPLAVPYDAVARTASRAAGELLESVALLSVYTGERVEAGMKSIALRFTLRANQRTLTEVDADAALRSAEEALAAELGGVRR